MVSYEIIDGKCEITYGVETIDTEAFKGQNTLIDIKIPNSVRFIGMHAFDRCTSLKEIWLPSSIEYIDSYAFEGCTSLERINIQTLNIKEIDRGLFENCSSLKEIDIPEGVKSIKGQAFSGCGSLSRVSLPASLEELEEIMYDKIFVDCNLDTITINPANKYYCVVDDCLLNKDGTVLIRGCNNSKIPNGVTEIAANAFSGCTRLSEIKIPGTVKNICEKAFKGCTSLVSIDIPSNVEEIDCHAFKGCSNLSGIHIDTKRTKFQLMSTFKGCPNAKKDGLYDDFFEQQ